MPRGVVIVGSGQAGFQTAASLRSEGYLEPITLIGEEPHLPYQRPPLSKGFPLGKQELDSIELRPEQFYADHNINLLRGEKAIGIDRLARKVSFDSGSSVEYEKLVLANGARNREINLTGSKLDGVLYLRTLDEAIALKQRIAAAKEIVVIGGGFIGLEMAAVASSLGKSVTVLEALPRLMSRVVAPVISDFFRELHAGNGVRVICDSVVREICSVNGKVSGVTLPDVKTLPADLVLVGIGVLPNIELAASAGLRTANGICVNEFLQTDDSSIFAIGDCAEHPCAQTGQRVRLESVQNAADQAQCAARTISGRPEKYCDLPWFWTDQFDVKLQMAGLSAGHDTAVTRGAPESRKFSVFYFRRGKFIAVDSVNRPLDHMIGRKLLSAGAALSPDQAGDESFDPRFALQNATGSAHR